MLKRICFDRFVALSWLTLVVAASGGCGAGLQAGDAGATRDDAGPAQRGRVGVHLDGGDLTDAGSNTTPVDAKPAVDASPVIDATVRVDTRTTNVQELLVNPAFDLAPLETGWTNPGIPIVYQALAPGGGETDHPDVAAQSQPNLAWFGGTDSADDRLTQSIAIPAGATQLAFHLNYVVITAKTGTTEVDTFDATLLAGTQVVSLAHLSNLDATGTWTLVSVPVPAALAGQTVTLQLHGVTNSNATRTTAFYIDTLSLQATPAP